MESTGRCVKNKTLGYLLNLPSFKFAFFDFLLETGVGVDVTRLTTMNVVEIPGVVAFVVERGLVTFVVEDGTVRRFLGVTYFVIGFEVLFRVVELVVEEVVNEVALTGII